jgi:hypothetical protein
LISQELPVSTAFVAQGGWVHLCYCANPLFFKVQ